jgi:hypothetical protein
MSISISSSKYNNLALYKTTDVNTEGVIYEFPYKGKVKLLKKLYINDGISFVRKLYTIGVLGSCELPDYFVVPDALVTIKNEIVGFTIPRVNGVTLKSLLNDNNVSLSDKINYLKSVGSILENMVNIREYTDLKNFYLNDMHESNFMVNFDTNNLCAIDLDGSKVNNSFSFPSRYLNSNALLNNVNKYDIQPDLSNGCYVMANRDSDLYCYVIMILNFLYGTNINNISIGDFYNYLNYLASIGVSGDLLNCFNRIVSYGPNENPMDYLDSLNSEMVCRAKKVVFDTVKRKKGF